MARRSAVAGMLMCAACTGGEPAPETQDADRPEAEAIDEQETVPQLEPGPEGAQPPAGETQPEGGTAERARQPTARDDEEPRDAEGGQQPAGQDTAEGVIAVTGTDIDSRPVIQTADGALGVTGDLTAELRRLSGARVRVEGERRSGRMPGESIDVSSYTVLEVNGERPEVGTITLRDGAPWLEGDDTVRLIGAADRLAGLGAAKVWVTGRRTDQGFEVGSYGVIRR